MRRLKSKEKYDISVALPNFLITVPYGSILSNSRTDFHADSFGYADKLDGLHQAGIQCKWDSLCPEYYSVSWSTDSLCLPYYLGYQWLDHYSVNAVKEMYGMEEKDCFKVSKVSKLADLKEGDNLSKSDLAIQIEDKLIQFEFIKDEDKKKKKTIIKPGSWVFAATQAGIKLEPISIAKKRLLLDVTNTSAIIEEANCFFSNLDVYRELERPLKRGVLLYSQPGLGKTASIGFFCEKVREEDPGTVVIVWPSAKIEAYQIEEFLSTDSEYDPSVTKVILILEDIGGGEVECGRRAVDSSLLNLLDGVTITFSIPTFIVATTNHPENLLKSLADRPGRFYLMMELKPPNAEERLKLLEFISKRELTEEEKKAISAKEADGLSIAHLDEIVVRSRLHRKSIMQTLEEILKHRAFMNKGFSREERTMGLGVEEDF